jgi:hypothetical protein
MDEEQSLFEMDVDHATGEELLDMSRWQRMFGVLIVISVGLVLLTLVLGWNKIATGADEAFASGGSQAAMAFLAVIVVLVALVAAIMAGLLVRGAARIKASIRTKEQSLFNSGLSDLKTFFIIYGVISLILLLGNLVAFL